MSDEPADAVNRDTRDGARAHQESDLRVLILEDVETDAELMEFELRDAGLRFSARRVAARSDFSRALDEWGPHIVLADFSLPGFDGMEALDVVRERSPHIPFVFVSGALGEERAIEMVKRGATDYVLKDRLSRLPPAVHRALEEADDRRARQEAEGALRRSERTQRALLQITNAAVSNLDRAALWEETARALADVVPFERASLVLLDPERDMLCVSTVVGDSEGMRNAVAEGTEFPREGSDLEAVVTERTTETCGDLETERSTEHQDWLLGAGIRSYVALPLEGKRGTLGALTVGTGEPHAYSPRHVEFLESAAHQISLAVENLLAYEEMRELRRQLELENVYLREEIQQAGVFGGILGRSQAILEIEEQIERVAPTDATVLVLGESGTGKELVAREIHARSDRGEGPLITVNCAAIPSDLYESEFFGHVKGAFSGAVKDREGRFAAADGGTLFLDEVGELPPDVQGKLLRALEDGTFQRVGENRTRASDVRVVAASNRKLEEDVREGRFREDLFYRLNVFPIEVPPLRDRVEDISLLAQHFVEQMEAKRPAGSEEIRLTKGNIAELQSYGWPGNVRELQNVIERAVITAQGGKLRFDLPAWSEQRPSPTTGAPSPGTDGRPQVVSEAEMERRRRENIRAALELTDGKIYGDDGAAALLGIPPTTLASRIKKLGVKR